MAVNKNGRGRPGYTRTALSRETPCPYGFVRRALKRTTATGSSQ